MVAERDTGTQLQPWWNGERRYFTVNAFLVLSPSRAANTAAGKPIDNPSSEERIGAPRGPLSR